MSVMTIKNDDVYSSYVNNLVSGYIGMAIWKRELKETWVDCYGGYRWINGKKCFGGRVNINDFQLANRDKLGDLIGLTEEKKDEIKSIDGSNDVGVYFYMNAKQIHTAEAIQAHIQYEVIPNVSEGYSFSFSMPTTVTTSSTSQPADPSASIPKIDPLYLCHEITSYNENLQCDTNYLSKFSSSELAKFMQFVHVSTSYFDANETVTRTYEYVGYDIELHPGLTPTGNYIHTFNITETVTLGSSYGDMSSIGNINTYIYPKFKSDNDEYMLDEWSTYSGTSIKSIAGHFWDIINDWTGSKLTFLSTVKIEGTQYYSDGAWSSYFIEEEHWDNLSPKETMILFQQMVDISTETYGGSWYDSFFSFVGGFLSLLHIDDLFDFVFNIPVINPIMLSVIYVMELVGVDENFIEDFETFYRHLRTIVLTMGAGYLAGLYMAVGSAAGSAAAGATAGTGAAGAASTAASSATWASASGSATATVGAGSTAAAAGTSTAGAWSAASGSAAGSIGTVSSYGYADMFADLAEAYGKMMSTKGQFDPVPQQQADDAEDDIQKYLFSDDDSEDMDEVDRFFMKMYSL